MKQIKAASRMMQCNTSDDNTSFVATLSSIGITQKYVLSIVIGERSVE